MVKPSPPKANIARTSCRTVAPSVLHPFSTGDAALFNFMGLPSASALESQMNFLTKPAVKALRRTDLLDEAASRPATSQQTLESSQY